MTTISGRKPRRNFWQTAALTTWRGGNMRLVCIALEPQCVVVKLKGTRSSFRLPWATIFDKAVFAEVLYKQKAKIAGAGKPRKYSVTRGKL